jgi:capsular exopolysaccharide synthesis family protein
VDLAAYLRVLRRRWYALVICVAAGLGGGYAYGHTQTPQYSATVRVFVGVPLSSSSVDEQLSGAQLSSAYVQTYAQVATSGTVVDRVAQQLHLPAGTPVELGAVPETGTYLIDISATSSIPDRAAAEANAAAAVLHDIATKITSGSSSVTVQTIDTAGVPVAPVSPRPTRDLFFGLILGVVIGVGAVVLLELLDRTVKSGEDAAHAAGAPLLGQLPRRRRGSPASINPGSHDPSAEAFTALRTAVRFLNPDEPLRTILVTSPSPGDGKTTVAGNLATVLARGGERVVVVDCDLRRGGLGRFYGVEPAVGVTSVLRREVRLRDALQTTGDKVRVLPTGSLPPNPAELLGSEAMGRLLDSLVLEADVIVIDAPPVLPVTDAVVLSAQVDCVLVVSRFGKTLRSSLQETVRRLRAVGAPVSGAVMTDVPASERPGYYLDYVYQEVVVSRPRPRPGPVEKAEGKPAAAMARSTSAADKR